MKTEGLGGTRNETIEEKATPAVPDSRRVSLKSFTPTLESEARIYACSTNSNARSTDRKRIKIA